MGKTIAFFHCINTFTFQTLDGTSDQIIISKDLYLAVLQGTVVKRYKYQNYALTADVVAQNMKHISFVQSEIWGVTTDGDLKIIKNNGVSILLLNFSPLLFLLLFMTRDDYRGN